MIHSKTSAILSLVICIASSVLLVVLAVTFPFFIRWLYFSYHALQLNTAAAERIFAAVIPAFYICVPIAAAALYMLIRLLFNVLHAQVFIPRNVLYLRLVSWCCYAVALVTLIFGFSYFPLLFITFIMAVVGTLLRVVKNVMQTAVELREENDLTI